MNTLPAMSDYKILMWTVSPPPPFLAVPPTIEVDLQTEDGRRVIECSAADAVPAANISWLLPEGVSGVSWFNFTSYNGSHSVRGVLLLPACSPWELTAECVINHPAFEEPQNRSITLPPCGMFNKSGGCLILPEWRTYLTIDFILFWKETPHFPWFHFSFPRSSPKHHHQLPH